MDRHAAGALPPLVKSRDMRVLIVDDVEAVGSHLEDILSACGNVEPDRRRTPGAALEVFKRNAFDVVLVDLKLPADGVEGMAAYYNGIPLIARMREFSKGPVIIAYSGDVDGAPPTEFARYDECIEIGADDVIGRENAYEWAPLVWRRKLDEWCTARRAKAGKERRIVPGTDLRTQAAMEVIGVERLATILREVIPEGRDDEIQALGGGFGGAIILRVRSAAIQPGAGRLKNVVKLSRDPWVIQDEFRRRPVRGSVASVNAVTPYTVTKVPVDGWTAFAVQEVEGYDLLADVVGQPGKLESALPRFMRALQALYIAPAANAELAAESEREKLLVSYSFASAVSDALGKWEHATALVSSKERERCLELRRMVESSVSGGWNVRFIKRYR